MICVIPKDFPATNSIGSPVIFRRLVMIALAGGLIGGAAASLIQWWQVTPIIIQAEQLESLKAATNQAVGQEHDEGNHSDHGSWRPQEGLERTAYMVLSNILTAFGFALVLAVSMAGVALKFKKNSEINVAVGIIWGLGGFVTFFAAPSVGIAPALPGVTSVALELRQWWWAGAVICSGVGLFLAYVLKTRWKWSLLVGLLSAPHIYGAPQAQNPYQDFQSVAAVQLSKMSKDFFLATGLSSLTLWLVLGIFSALAVKRYIDIEN